VVLDERSAAFAALGASKTDRIPTILICTSGTAVANYLPAVVEAFMTRTPLLLLTADRPEHLQNTGAPQTIRQPGIFSHFAELIEIPPAKNSPDTFKTLGELADIALEKCRNSGIPVHLNIPFDKPLEPEAAYYEEIARSNRFSGGGTWFAGEFPAYPEPDLPGKVFKRPVIVAGPRAEAPLEVFFEPDFLNIPMFAEITSQLSDHPNSVRGFDAFLRGPFEQPDVILRVGKSPVTPALQRFLEQTKVPVFVLQEDDMPDDAALNGVIPFSESFLPEILNLFTPDRAWTDFWRIKEAAVPVVFPPEMLTDGAVMHTLMHHETLNEWNLHLSNSMPVRDADLFGSRGWMGRVFCNRGVSGIDGVFSTAIGAADSLAGRNLLVIGDLAMLHDIGALTIAAQIQPDLLVILINNGGGNIFDMLPIRSLTSVFEPFFLTPRPVQWEKACAAFSIPYTKSATQETFESALESAIEQNGVRIIEAVTSREASMGERRRLWSYFQHA
jgi:2-succinyl-5-enolpyruvyl-6-hydroxy-3-cyclohexene-1-carboxylate synthase